MHGAVFRRYPPVMSMSAWPEPEPETETEIRGRDAFTAGRDLHVNVSADPILASQAGGPPSSSPTLGILRIEIHGSWSVADLTQLLGRLEDSYKAAAALESLIDQRSTTTPSTVSQSSQLEPASAGLSTDDLLETVTVFQLAGGLRLGSLHYGSPGFLEVIGALNPLKTVKDGITENREINRKRDKTRRLDEREREQQVMQHQEVMARESREREQQQHTHALEVARLQMEAEAARFKATSDLIDRLPRAQQSVTAAQLIQRLMGNTEAIANDARIDEARMLEQTDSAAPSQSSDTISSNHPERRHWPPRATPVIRPERPGDDHGPEPA